MEAWGLVGKTLFVGCELSLHSSSKSCFFWLHICYSSLLRKFSLLNEPVTPCELGHFISNAFDVKFYYKYEIDINSLFSLLST